MSLLLSIITTGFYIFQTAIIIYVFMSWVPSVRQTGFGRLLGRIVEPYLSFWRFIPPLFGVLDLSPIVALFGLQLAEYGLLNLLMRFFG